MGRVRRCNARCHRAKGTRCSCWCAGSYHGSGGAANRENLFNAVTETDREKILTEHGFKKGETTFIEQMKLLEVQSANLHG